VSTNARRVDAVTYRFRLVRPDPDGDKLVLGKPYSVLALPSSHLPGSPDFAQGTYSVRDGDAGEFSVTFPNAANGEGYLYRELFDPDGDRQFLEIWQGRELEFVGVVQRVDVDRSSVTVSGADPSVLLRKAYERDRPLQVGPVDLIHLYTYVPRVLVADSFEGASLDPAWTLELIGPSGGTTTSVVDGAFRITETIGGQTVEIRQAPTVAGGSYMDWDFRTVIRTAPRGGDAWTVVLEARVTGGGADLVRLTLDGGLNLVSARSERYPGVGSIIVAPAPIPADPTYPCTLSLEARGRWVRAFIDGRLVAFVPNLVPVGTFAVQAFLSTTTNFLELETVSVLAPLPWLQGEQSTVVYGDQESPVELPYGGLKGSYFADNDLAGIAAGERRYRILAPDREPFAVRQDKAIDTNVPATLAIPPAGGPVGDRKLSARWTGSVYLPLASGTSTEFAVQANAGARLWVGNLEGVPIIDTWDLGVLALDTQSVLHSLLGSVDGWVPIRLEWYSLENAPVVRLGFDPDVTYTDPGGTVITPAWGGNTIPTTSLSPMGVVDERVQGQSHFDLAYGTARDYGHSMRFRPWPFEHTFFPGLLYPERRMGRDTDVLLVEEEDEKGEPILTPGRTLDSSDQAVRVRGSANGLNGNRGNLTADVMDSTAAKAALFVTERWVDAGEVGDERLLSSRLSQELTLIGSPWEELRGTPLAQDRLADSWPLTGALAAMRWEPGDGVRVRVRDCGIDDVLPRRITQVTRTFGVEGRTGATVSFRNRPRGAALELRRLIRAQAVAQRSVTPQLVTIPGEYAISNPIPVSAYGAYTRCLLMPGDEVVRAYFRLALNTANMSLQLWIGPTNVTTALGGPWDRAPMELDVTAYARGSGTDPRVYASMFNAGAGTTITEYQLIVEVLRRR